jgi:hypothetical protein
MNAVTIANAHRLVAIGDLHGDIENAKEALRLAQVTDDAGHWATGTDTVVQMGDVVDRGPHGHTIMEMLERLKREAAAAGGELVTLLGNHELMNFAGDVKFVVPQHFEVFGPRSDWSAAFQDPTQGYGALIANRPAAVIRNNTVFVHAGITKEVAAQGTIEQLNERVSDLLHRKALTDPLLTIDGPVWTRRLIYAAQLGKCEETYAALQEINRVERLANPHSPRVVRRMVVGHTIQPNGMMRIFCNQTLLAIDIAISQYMQNGGHLGHLELKPPAMPGGVEVPWFWYPPKPAARHILHRPELPRLMPGHPVDALAEARVRLAAAQLDVDLLDNPHQQLTTATAVTPTAASSKAPHAAGSYSSSATRWLRPHRAGGSERDHAAFLAGIALLVVAWRIVHNFRQHRVRAANKKHDMAI